MNLLKFHFCLLTVILLAVPAISRAAPGTPKSVKPVLKLVPATPLIADQLTDQSLSAPTIIRVATDSGSDASDGSSWALAKKTISSALTALTGSGEIWVKVGSYTENITINDRSHIKLLGGFSGSENNPNERPTISQAEINAEHNGRPLTILDSFDLIVDRFDLTNGQVLGYGGGLYLSHGLNIQLSNIRAKNNQISSSPTLASFGIDGGGIYINTSHASLDHIWLENNTVPGSGGGLAAVNSSLDLDDLTVSQNQAGQGGGLSLASVIGRLNSSFIFKNIAAKGSALELSEDSRLFKVTNSIISSNEATELAAIYVHGFHAEAKLINNTISYNTGGQVIGLMTADYARPDLHNNLFAFNGQPKVVSIDPGQPMTDHDSSAKPDDFTKNDFFHNAGPDFAKAEDLVEFGPQTVHQNPDFISKTLVENPLSYQLGPDSQVTDLGTDGLVDEDFQKGPRPINSHNDLGAFEWQGVSQLIDMTFWDPGNQSTVLAHVVVKQLDGTVLDDSWVPQSANGFYRTGGLFPAGSGPYNVFITTRGRLTAMISGHFPAFNSPGQNVQLIAGDSVLDNNIGLADVSDMIDHFGEATNENRDITGNGVVDAFDLNLGLVHYNQTGAF